MQRGSITKGIAAAVLVLVGAGCHSGPQRAPAIGEAYVGPATLRIRSDIPLDSAAVTTVKHGDRLEIIGRRRRFLRVRTPSGAEGWTDERELLNSAEMSDLKDLAQRAAKLPPQGDAVSYRELNVHTLPAGKSPTFLVVKDKEKVEVLTHVVVTSTDVQRQPLIPRPEKKAPPPKKPKKEPKVPPVPMPAPPPLPANWLELSKTERDEEPPEPAEEKPKPTEDWSLIRTKSGQTGWVLTRRLSMAIPDDVAQYAEGHRIVSYFSLGEVQDDDVKKPIWLWTTVTGRPPYDFDSFRVFIWSLKRHRYETAYIERRIQGYAPVLLRQVTYGGGKSGTTANYPGFSVCLESADGQRHRREYALLGNVVRSAGDSGPCEAPPSVLAANAPVVVAPGSSGAQAPPSQPSERWKERIKKKWKGWFGG